MNLLEHLEGLNERATANASNYHDSVRARNAAMEFEELFNIQAFLEAVRCLKMARQELYDHMHSHMSGEEFHADPTIAQIDAALAPFMEQVK